MPLKLKYKIKRKVKEHNRKMKRLAKAHPELVRRRRKQDPGVPNLWPWKEALIDQAIEQKAIAENEAELAKQAKKAAKEQAEREAEELARQREMEYKTLTTPEGRRKWFFRELKQVIEASDVVIEVLDARDPLGCRALDIEEYILKQQNPDGSPSKRLVLVLNKIDMVPPENVAAWVQYLRRFYPTLPFKSSTSQSGGHLGSLNLKTHKVTSKALQTANSVGGQALLQLLKNYARTQDTKKSITVGIIGYPNVGKSSIINSLKRARAVQVSASAGCTRSLQEIRLDSNITLVDSPGVLFAADEEGNANTSLLLRNALRVEQVEDPQIAVEAILQRCSQEMLMVLYQIPAFTTTQDFLLHVARARGKIGARDIPNLDAAARIVLKDWNTGKIPFYTEPPKVDDITETKIVPKFSEKFDIDALLDEANEMLFARLRGKDSSNDMDDGPMAEGEADDMGDEVDIPPKWSSLNPSKLMASGVVVMESDDEEEPMVQEHKHAADDDDDQLGRTGISMQAASALYGSGKAATMSPELQQLAAQYGGRLPKKMLEALSRGESIDDWLSSAAATAQTVAKSKAGRAKVQAIELGGNFYGEPPVSKRALEKKARKRAEKEKRRQLANGPTEIDPDEDYDINVDWE